MILNKPENCYWSNSPGGAVAVTEEVHQMTRVSKVKASKLFLILMLLSTVAVFGEVRLPKLISDGMVLQRDEQVKIWGWAASNEKIALVFMDSTYSIMANENGEWHVTLQKMSAGGPYEMRLNASNKIVINDIFIGDVWVCSGQSNMELPMSRVSWVYPDEIANSENFAIRQFYVPRKYDFNNPLSDFETGSWKSASPESVHDFSAVAYFYAKELYEKYQIPIGLINASLGGSPAEAWMSEEALKEFPDHYEEAQRFKDSLLIKQIEEADTKRIGVWHAQLRQKDEGYQDPQNLWYSVDLNTLDWASMEVPGYWADGKLGPLNGVVWFRKKINIPSSMVGSPAKLILGSIVDADSVFVNEVFVGATSYRYPPRRYDLPPDLLTEGQNTIVVRVINSAGNGGFVPDKPYEIVVGKRTIDLRGDWQYRLGATMAPLARETFIRWKPLGLYNAMIAPILNYGIKGVIWYQGESNAGRAIEYRNLFPALIRDWRNNWKIGDFPFLFVQLASYMESKNQPSESHWALLREAQLKTLSVPNTGMAVTIDVGEWNDIHPVNKKDVGKRLALAAQKIAYGDETVVHSGPIYKSMKVDGTKIILTFTNVGSGLTAKGDVGLSCFAISGADSQFVWAQTKVEGNTVIVWSEDVANPVAVRYAWADNPQGANLFNIEGLPASPFRTDSGESQITQRDYPITPVLFTAVTLTDKFWSKRIEINRTVSIPFGFNKCEEEGRIRNFAKAGELMEGEYEGKMPFDDTDVYKIIEGASYSLKVHPDVKLEQYIDDILIKIAAAQKDDGYLCTWKTLDPDTTPAWWVKPGPRWHDLGASHELYNAGHMYEAAFAHYQATGKRNFLDIALKNANLIVETFGPGKKLAPPGHQVIETGLVKLYRATHNKKYLDQAKFFLDQRGNAEGHELYGDYSQDHIPLAQQDEAVGHAVRAVYMYAGMADIAAIEKDTTYLKAIDKIWDNVVSKKMYVTGGIGARHKGEAFGDNYELPNPTSYNETCAAIGNVYWNHRMFLLHGDAKYLDVLERTLYNGMLSGVSLSGDLFFYPNPLESDGKYEYNIGKLGRQPWFDCSCCPSNVMRFIPSVTNYIYAHRDDDLYVNLFVAGNANIELKKTPVRITQETNYPWDGKVVIKVDPVSSYPFVLNVRIPGWATGNPLPSDLYYYVDETRDSVSLTINGSPLDLNLKNGFAVIERQWARGDLVELNLPMPVRRVAAHANVVHDQNKIALTRGPLVYCAEAVDNAGKVFDLVVPNKSEFRAEYKSDLLGGVTVIKGNAVDKSGEDRELTAIPYYAWAHRGNGEMAVWLPRK
jgi:sialate O-acetylesterase